ncbi:MAG: VTT domain-containing protein [Firmicutes bacterium]|nr:VTT domain-containing protein [Bacillota bacterium]
MANKKVNSKRDGESALDVAICRPRTANKKTSKHNKKVAKAIGAVLLKFGIIFGVMAVVAGAIYLLFRLTGLTQYLRDLDLLTQTIRDFGPPGAIIYVVFVIISIVALPVPGILIILAGVAIYGPLLTILLVSIGTLIGSMMAFAMGRIFGKSLIFWLFGKEKAAKYIAKITKNSRVPLISMLILPFFPDDMLCMAAGVSDISWGEFFFIVIVARLPVVAITAFFGSGIIPFDGWGRIVWIILATIAVVGILIWFANKVYLWTKEREKKKET